MPGPPGSVLNDGPCPYTRRFRAGVVLVAAFGLEALIGARARPLPVWGGWGIFGVVSLAASLLTPHGIDGLMFPLQVSGMTSLPLIIEWQPTSFGRSEEHTSELQSLMRISYADF